jgi:NB-ARC domain-containing protein
VDGGRGAARGFLYQYLRTVEAVLLALRDNDFYACRIEGDPAPDQLRQADLVDFDVIDHHQQVVRAVQVKSGGASARLDAGAVFRIFAGLVTRVDAQQYWLLTDINLSSPAVELTTLLARDQSSDERRGALEQVLANTKSLTQLRELADDEIDRLGRCTISRDRRDREELAGALRQDIRDVRRRTGQSLGPQSSGLLLAYLAFEVHCRASSLEGAVWTMQDVREALGLSDHDLAAALGERDWGGVLGPMTFIPDVKRSALLTEMVDHLKPYRSSSRTVGKVVLSGLSGIGKSSMAAGYLAEYADSYDTAFWIDASTPATVANSFRAIAPRLGVDTAADPEDLRIEVHHYLSALAGRWLMVFDDATPHAISQWIPRIGDGDVLITTLDSTYTESGAHHVPVQAMPPEEAIPLLQARLTGSVDLDEDDTLLLAQLATALDGWPLAMELAAGYLRSCGYTTKDIPYYIDNLNLRLRSLSDTASKPAGYPRTLVAAINLTVEGLPRRNRRVIAMFAVEMLGLAAYVASQQIPVHLLASAVTSEFDAMPTDQGPMVVADPEVHEAVRALKQLSLVRDDRPLPRRDVDPPTAERAIAVNTVVQEVLRARIETRSNLDTRDEHLKRLAFHLEIWLSASKHNGEYDKTHVLIPHCVILVNHILRCGIAGQGVSILLGNLATVHIARKEWTDASRLLEIELDYLASSPASSEFLIHQVLLHFAMALSLPEQAPAADVTRAIDNLERIYIYAQTVIFDPEKQRSAAIFCQSSIDVLDNITIRDHEQARISQLVTVFADLKRRVPAVNQDIYRAQLADAETSIDDNRHADAEKLCRDVLRAKPYGSNFQIEAQRFLGEALVGQCRWHDSITEIDNLARQLGADPVYRDSAEKALYNIGSGLTAAICKLGAVGGREPLKVLEHLLSRPCFVATRRHASDEYSAKYDTLQLLVAISLGHIDDVHRLLEPMRYYVETESTIRDSENWLMIAEITLRTGRRVLAMHADRLRPGSPH